MKEQASVKIETISRFDGQYSCLSNFYPSPIQIEERLYATVEHAFQAMKTLDENDKDSICAAATPGIAKRMGRKVKLRSDWEDIKLEVMKNLLFSKFGDPVLLEKLKLTGNANLIEGNTWGDRFWGVCDGVGENHLGKLLMQIRKSFL